MSLLLRNARVVQGGGAPTLVYQGRQDAMVPFAHGEWLATHVSGTEAHLTDEDGHLTWMINGLPAILADLKRRAGL